MILSRDRGGMGAPNMLNYYKASLLDQLRFWWHPLPQKAWSFMERSQFPGQDPKLTLIALKLGFSPPKLDPDPTLALLHIGIHRSPLASRSLIFHILLIAKSVETPSFFSLPHKLSYHYTMEKWLSVQNNTMQKLHKSWALWLQHLKGTLI